MANNVKETEGIENENTNKEPENGKAKTYSIPGNPVDHPLLVVIFSQFLEVDHQLFRP